MFPMVLPSAMPTGRRVAATALVIEVGVVGLAISLFIGRSTELPTLLVVAGLGLFLSNVRWMTRHRRPPPAAQPQPDWGARQSMCALASLALAAALGVWLVLQSPTPWSARVAMAYGALGLVGGLSQIIVGIEHRLLPMFHWHTTFAGSGYARRPPPAVAMGSQGHRFAVFMLWALAVPLLVAGLSIELPTLVQFGAASLFAATSLHAVGTIRILHPGRHATYVESADPPLAR